MIKILKKYAVLVKCTSKTVGFILFFSFFFASAQVDIRIDKMLDLSEKQYIDHQYIHSLNTADQALQLAKKKSYSKGIIRANIFIAKALEETGIYKNALEYLENAEKENFFVEYTNAQIETYRLRGRIYLNLQMNDLALREFYKQLKFSDQIKDPLQQKRSKLWAHQNIAETFLRNNRRDSAWKHLMIQKQILKSFPENNSKGVFYDISTTYTSIGKEYLFRKNTFAARKYIDSAMNVLSANDSPYLYETLEAYGDVEDAAGNKEMAVEYYRKALKNTIQIQNKSAEKFVNKKLADFFSKNNLNDKEENRFLKRYQELNDSLNLENSRATELIVNNFLKKKDEHFQKEKVDYAKGIVLVLILVVGLVAFLFWQNRKKRERLLQIKNVLNEKEHLVENLLQEGNSNKFNELIMLGKRNDPQFIILFKELYPDFVSKLKAADPGIKTSELIFCAMIYLNFSTKDISEYCHVTIRAVQIRKNRLRKKHHIASDKDLSGWMRNL